jgi:hypothetical protein
MYKPTKKVGCYLWEGSKSIGSGEWNTFWPAIVFVWPFQLVVHAWTASSIEALRGGWERQCSLWRFIYPNFFCQRLFFAGEGLCSYMSLSKLTKVETFSRLNWLEFLSSVERKTRVYWFSMSIVHTKQSGVAFELVTVLLRDLLEWNFHQGTGFEKSNFFNARF